MDEESSYACCGCDSEFTSRTILLQHFADVHYDPTLDPNGDLLCHYCMRIFTNESNLSAHIELHEYEGQIFSCNICRKCFKTETMLRLHQGETMHKCPCCLKIFSKSHIGKHLEEHRRAQLYDCSTCYVQIRFKDIIVHMKLHNSEGEIVSTCDKCAKAFPSRKSYNLHMKRGHDTFPCDICLAVEFNSKEQWRNHRNIHFAGSFPCPICQKVFTETAGLKNHQDIYSHHTNGMSKTRIPAHASVILTENCPLCIAIFTSRNEMKAHIRKQHVDLLVYQCEDCNEISFGKEEYLAHKQFIHSFKSKCQVCLTEFVTDKELTIHLSQHRLSKNVFVCEVCESEFTDKESLLKHKRTHSTSLIEIEEPEQQMIRIPSNQNSTTIQSPLNLNYHPIEVMPTNQEMFSSSIIIMYRCKPCNILFRGDDKFQEHKRTVHQTNFKTFYICKHCKLTFQSMLEFNQHQEHTCSINPIVYKPYLCLKCNNSFMLEGSLRLHSCMNVSNQQPSCRKSCKYMPDLDDDINFVLT